MFRNKYVFWGGIAAWVLILAGGGAGFWYLHRDSKKATFQASSSQSAAQNITQPSQAANTIEGTNPQSSANNQTVTGSNGKPNPSSPQVAGDSTSQNETAKLLDPKTFSQYDKYKNDQNVLYIDLQKGDGATLTVDHKAAVYYRGWLTNGQLFDESKAGSDGALQPFVLTLGAHQVITGWEQGLDGMKVGGVRLLIVPPAVGYGANGQGSIPGNSVLVFQVQLAQVE